MTRLLKSVVLLVITASSASAQSRPDEPDQSIGVGAQWALPQPAGAVRPGAQVSWRRWRSSRFGVGADVRWWRSNTTIEIDTPTQHAQGGVVVPAQRGREDRRTSSYAAGAALLAKGSAGRVSLVGGIGPAFFVDATAHESRINESFNAGREERRSVGVQMLAEVEGRATRRLSGFVGLRAEWRDVRVSESLSGYPTAGVRFAF